MPQISPEEQISAPAASVYSFYWMGLILLSLCHH